MISSCEESYTSKIICLHRKILLSCNVVNPERPHRHASSHSGKTRTSAISCANVSDETGVLTPCWASAMASRPRQNPAYLCASRPSKIPILRNRLLRPLLLRQPRQLHRLECLLLRRLSAPRDLPIECDRGRTARQRKARELLRRRRQHRPPQPLHVPSRRPHLRL